ncbi:D-inositol-3-phosphate glycosyltransferase [Haloferula sargassicola]|uniref:D-inositol-3-phosphate glycosyltransferase n=2 Tax=Haloferula sargassicola TaxID=490096 RepID=A0ABP9URJ6_9BACT
MTLHGLEALLENPACRLHFIASEENSILLKRLAALAADHPQLTFEETDEQPSRFEALRHIFCRGRIADLAATIQRFGPDAVISVQGGLELSSLGIQAARQARVKAISYLAMPHTYQTMGARLAGLLDSLTPTLLTVPDAFITLSDEMAELLRQRGAKGPVEVLYPGIDTALYSPGDRAGARRHLSLPEEAPVFACVGRIDFSQKQQDRLLRAVARPNLEDCHLVFGGDGPDSSELDEQIEAHQLRGRVRRLPWIDTVALYRAADAVVIPSRYEGVPLVMLEALACGTPVLGTDRDGMRDVLPENYRIDTSSSLALSRELRKFLDEGTPAPDPALCQGIRSRLSLDSFRDRFREIITHLVG